jgi:hypothetical protein
MKKLLVITLAFILFHNAGQAQGCVAVRSTGAFCTRQDAEKDIAQKWQLNLGYRFFKSYKHFVGREEQKERVEKHTDVRNWQHSVDLSLVRHLDKRWSLALNVPILSNARSSLYEHGGNNAGENARHFTRSFGVGDIRFSVYHWLLDPVKSKKGNIQIGLGIKLPTGDYKYQDFFYKTDSTPVLGPVDQSIQLGDGGTGFTTEINAYYNFSRSIGVYGNFYYLLNPREQNGVSTARGSTPSASSIAYKSSTMSVPDQYMVRAGANLFLKRLSFSAGMRMECVPARDLVGGSTGFRRPGFIISAEPGVTYLFKSITAFASVPVAVVRNRTQSVPDKIRTELTGVYAKGDAAFADYLINVGISYKF